ncbi:hypothetical protein INR49_031731 [Caranx melampygus]|nr:hypothetical protein INR49_031731 [Caranx melampygus]
MRSVCLREATADNPAWAPADKTVRSRPVQTTRADSCLDWAGASRPLTSPQQRQAWHSRLLLMVEWVVDGENYGEEKGGKQNRAGRFSLTDQNTLFSDFSPFTRGDREAASLGPLEPCGEHNTNLTGQAVQRVSPRLKDTETMKDNKRLTSQRKHSGGIRVWL